MCFVWISEQTARVSLYSINISVFKLRQSVYCVLWNGSSNQTYSFVLKGLKYFTVQWFIISKRALLCLKVPILYTCLPSDKSSIKRKMHIQHWQKDTGCKKYWKRKCAWDIIAVWFSQIASIIKTDQLVLYRKTCYFL